MVEREVEAFENSQAKISELEKEVQISRGILEDIRRNLEDAGTKLAKQEEELERLKQSSSRSDQLEERKARSKSLRNVISVYDDIVKVAVSD